MSSVPPHDSGLRDTIADIISRHPTLTKQELVIQLTKDFGSLGSAILAKLAENNMIGESEEERDKIGKH